MLSVNATVLITFALVWILVLVLTRVFFKPVGRVLDERSSRIEGDNEAARKSLAEYESDLGRIENRLREARAASDEIWARNEAEALKEKTRIVQEIQAESRALVEKSKRALAVEIERLKKDVDARTDAMAGEIERRILH